jgi:hypothetical protein
MKRKKMPGTIFVLVSLLTVNYAASSSTSAQVSVATEHPLVLIGPVEAIDAKTNTAVIVGQRVLLGNLKPPAIGAFVEVFGTVAPDSAIHASLVKSVGSYVAGASPILVTGLVKAIDRKLARVTIGNLVIDYSAGLSSNPSMDAKAGGLGQFVGTQPVTQGIVLASLFRVTNRIQLVNGGVSLEGIIGGGFAADGIIGGGASADGIIGGGVAVDGIIGGGKLSVDGIIGGGR